MAPRSGADISPTGWRRAGPQKNRLTFFFPFSVFRVILRLVRTSAAGRGERKMDRDTETTSPVGSAEARPLRQAERRLRRP